MEVDSKEQYPDSIFESFEEEDAVEIIKRFNAYPQLIEAFQWFCDRVDKGEVKSVQTYARFKELLADTAPPAQDGPLPFTVVVGYQNPDDFRDTNTYHLHITDALDNLHEACTIAIDDLIAEKSGIDHGDEDRTERVDVHRPEYKVIAIYPGHLQNLVK